MEHLLGRFARSAVRAGASAAAVEVEGAAMDLLRRWSEPHRAYHDARHLSEVLHRLDELGCEQPDVQLAAWFHDAVYTGTPGRDERASADLARSELTALGVPHDTGRRVHDLVLVTADHRPPEGDAGAAALCDADLGVLAADPVRYRDYLSGVRREYAHLDDDAFAAGRAAVLGRLLERPALFVTEAARTRWEVAARCNVEAELADLTR